MRRRGERTKCRVVLALNARPHCFRASGGGDGIRRKRGATVGTVGSSGSEFRSGWSLIVQLPAPLAAPARLCFRSRLFIGGC